MVIKDKVTWGLTARGREVMEKLMSGGSFKEQQDAAKFALAIAIKAGVRIRQAEGTSTVWNQGTFDPDGEFKSVLLALHPEVDTPYRAIEYLIDAGLEIIDVGHENEPEIDTSILLDIASAPVKATERRSHDGAPEVP